MGEGRRERERERIPSRLRAVSAEPDAGVELTNCGSREPDAQPAEPPTRSDLVGLIRNLPPPPAPTTTDSERLFVGLYRSLSFSL